MASANALFKVVHVITRLDMGGSAQNTLETCLGIDPARFAVSLLHGLAEESQMTEAESVAVRAGIDRARARGVRVVPIPALVRRIDLIKDVQALLAITHFLRREKPDIVHTHTSKAGLLGRLAARLAGVNTIVHTPHGHVFYGHFGPAAARLFLVLEKLAARITHRLIALTEQERSDYEHLKVAPAGKLMIAHSGVRIDRFQNGCRPSDRRNALPELPEDAFVIGYVGWLVPVKGVATLVEAMGEVARYCPRARLVLVGKGSLENQIRMRTRRLGIEDRVVFLGWRSDIEQILPGFDLFVLPSLNEGTPLAVIEAMAAARPIVASDTGGIPDLAGDGVNGILVPPADAKALAEGILHLIRHPKQARRMGLQGRQIARAFSVEAMVQRIEKCYDEAMGRTVEPSMSPTYRRAVSE